jgi:hypothetical protein
MRHGGHVPAFLLEIYAFRQGFAQNRHAVIRPTTIIVRSKQGAGLPSIEFGAIPFQHFVLPAISRMESGNPTFNDFNFRAADLGRIESWTTPNFDAKT